MKKLNLFLLLLCGMMTACSEPLQEIDKPVEVEDTEVRFKAFINQATRATETSFEADDAISVFAVEPSANIKLEASGNYADNVKYIYDGSKFAADSKSIAFDETYEEGLAYFAIYPYSYSASSKYTFTVKNDQSNYANYTASDLCTAYNEPTTDETVLLEFSHRLSNIIIKFQGENLASKNLSVEINDVYTSCDVDINANTYQAKGNRENIVMGEESGNTFHAIIVPQNVSADDTFMTVSLNGKQITLSLNNDTNFKSGRKHTYEFEIKDDKIVALNGFINPWNTEEEEPNNWFEQELYSKTNEKENLYPYNSIYVRWAGENIVSLKYGIAESSVFTGYSDSEIISVLKELDNSDLLNKINNGGVEDIYFYDLEGSTSYTLCTQVTYKNGDTKFVKTTHKTEAAPVSNDFTQRLYSTKEYENQGYHDYDSLFVYWEGTSVKRVQYGLFTTSALSDVSDTVIKQNLTAEEDSEGLAKINNGGVTYVYDNLTSDTNYTLCTLVTFNNGKQELYKTTASTAEIPEEERLEVVVPSDILVKLDDYIPVYNGVNPPNVEGTYFMDPSITVYCEDYVGGDSYYPGYEVASCYIEFSNQNTKKNTLDYYEESTTGNSVAEGKGAFISGSGNNFTAFFNTVGEAYDIYIKEALVISGTKTSSGIKNLHYAFVMVEKGPDPDGILMNEGVFRVFKDGDGMSYATTRGSVVYDENRLSTVSAIK